MKCIVVLFSGDEDNDALVKKLLNYDTVFLFHSIDRGIFADSTQTELTERIEKTEDTMEKLKEKLRMKGIKVLTDSGWGDVAERVKALKELLGADKIFLQKDKTIYTKRFIDKLSSIKGFEALEALTQPSE